MIQERVETLERRNDTQHDQALSTADLARGQDVSQTALQTQASNPAERVPLFVDNERDGFRQRWQDIQASFVDDPRSAVKNGDELVASLMTRLAQVFADERGKLEHEWDKGADVSTEDLRVLLQRYRSFFDRLLSV
jgi:hypothetical protein